MPRWWQMDRQYRSVTLGCECQSSIGTVLTSGCVRHLVSMFIRNPCSCTTRIQVRSHFRREKERRAKMEGGGGGRMEGEGKRT